METITTNPTTTTTPLANISTATFVQVMQSSFTSSKFALQQELGCALAMFASTGRVDADTKKKLRDIYVASGWDASTPESVDYKTTMRRCQTASVLYTHIGRDVIVGWVSGMVEVMIINTIVQNLAPLNLSSMDGVLAYCGKVRQPPKPRPVAAPTAIPEAAQPQVLEGFAERRLPGAAPKALVEEGGLAEGEHGPLQPSMYRRASDREVEQPMDDAEARRYQSWLALHGGYPVTDMEMLHEGYKQIKTEHMAVALSPLTTKDEILKAVFDLMQLANALTGTETVGDIKMDINGITDVPPLLEEAPQTLEQVIAEFQEKEKAKALANIEPEETPEEAAEVIRHQAEEATRLEAEAIAAKKTPIAVQPSRYRAKPITKK